MKYNNLKERNIYLNQLIAFKDTEPVKVITGIRRCGKSSLLKLMQEYLLKSGVGKDQIISMNFESLEFHDINYKDLYEYVKKRIPQNKKSYLFAKGVKGSGDRRWRFSYKIWNISIAGNYPIIKVEAMGFQTCSLRAKS